jgi:hypothetical protein
MRRLAAAFAVLIALAASGVGTTCSAAETAKSAYRLKGFRSAHFGMTKAQVKATIQESVIAEGRTPVLLIRVAALFSQSGVGEVAYLFGYHSNKLVQVTVSLSTQTDPELNADRLVVDGKVLQNYLLGLGYPAKKILVNQPAAVGLVLFQGIDPDGRLTSLQLQGQMTRSANGQMTLNPQLLRLNYVSDPEHPDMMKSLAGQF